MVTGCWDHTARIWETPRHEEPLILKGHTGTIYAAAFSPDGRRIVTGGWDHTARVWEAASLAQVERWHQEQQAGAEYVAAQERALAAEAERRAAAVERDRAERAQDPGAIKQWLVLLPIPAECKNGPRALREEQVERESQLHPRAGERSKVGPAELVWREARLEDYVLDFNQLLGAMTEWSVAYAVAYIHSETAQRDLVMKVGSDDEAKIYLNGKLVYQNPSGRRFVADQDMVTSGVELKAGLNVLVFKVVNDVVEWKGSIRFTDALGQPLKGL
jgi:hypothetical protein